MNTEQELPPSVPPAIIGGQARPVDRPGPVATPDPPRQPPRGIQSSREIRRHLLSVRMILNAMLFLALMYTITLTRALLIPLVLAAFLGLALNPLVAAGARVHLPRWLSASVLMLALIVGMGAGVAQLSQPAVGWIHRAPAAIRNFVPKLKSMTRPLEAANRATQSLVNVPGGRVAPPASATLAISMWDVVSTAPKVLAAVLGVMLLVFFFLVYGDSMLRRLVEITPGFSNKRHAVAIVRGIQTEVSRYLLTALSINAGLGAITAAMLWLYRMPDPLLWGAVAMFANFVPYVGAICTAVVLVLVGMLGAREANLHAFLPAMTFSAITVLEGNLITPMIQGRSMRLSPIAILLWLLVWGWLWGVPGALLAVPMLTCTKLIAERVRSWRWFAVIVQR
ncbi:MAG: AI-2E family transporter [Pseudomonadota bacterium]|jgi:predicted PurR-regulated permease PerM|nr:AI-2E family transporter [Pseudomonadota bacterium]